MEQGKILSIRLSPDGLSFWTTGLRAGVSKDGTPRADLWSRSVETSLDFDPALDIRGNTFGSAQKIRAIAGNNFSRVEILPDTLKNVCVPGELLTDGTEFHYLSDDGIIADPGEEVFKGELSPEAAFIIAYDAEAMQLQNEVWQRECDIISPFTVNDSFITKYGPGRRRVAAMYLTSNNAYISVFEKRSGSRLYMDTLRWSTEADLLYALTLLDKEFDLKKSKIYLRGANAEQPHKVLRKYYRKSRCE